MRVVTAIGAGIFVVSGIATMGQEQKPVPKDSARVSIPGCTRGYVFTVGRRTTEEPGSVNVPEGTHFRMNGPKKLINEIKAHEGAMIELTGITKKGQYLPGVGIGGGVRVSPGSSGGIGIGNAGGGQLSIDVEGWRQIDGRCPTR